MKPQSPMLASNADLMITGQTLRTEQASLKQRASTLAGR